MDSVPRSYEAYHKSPALGRGVYVAPSANLIGDVRIGEESSVWFQCVLRADINGIEIGHRTNIQDGTVVHVADRFGTKVGNWVTVGHRAVLHACTVEDEVLVGMGAILLDGSVIGRRSIVGAGALVTAGTEVPPGSLVMGAPARILRSLSGEEQDRIRRWAERYVVTTREYLKQEPK
jgi:gamma-carbonic anhydrase